MNTQDTYETLFALGELAVDSADLGEGGKAYSWLHTIALMGRDHESRGVELNVPTKNLVMLAETILLMDAGEAWASEKSISSVRALVDAEHSLVASALESWGRAVCV